MVRFAVLIVAALALTGCASTAMKRYVGSSISEAYLAYGQPANVFDLPDGRRAFQFYWGGSSGVLPGSSQTTVAPIGGGAYAVNTVGTPAMVYESKGCLVSLIARKNAAGDFVVEEYRIPQRLVC
ncbi:hypothetical protein [Sphingorhabdus sp. EL138]|jgi:hypothetical protein|uniref:hypothetical protein n=1 Tax=Sphingorhabdus sp. EL138 TaxID=2073156 RepID=UPI0025E0DC62|nr:hypothetical protein [Sphingorhabdus sp. EL138]